MADEAAHLRAVAKFVPAIAADPQDADVLAAAQGSIESAGRHIQRMQKTLTQMNIQVAMC